MKEPEKPWRVIDSQVVYEASPWIRVSSETVETGSGTVIDDFHRVKALDFALVFARDENRRVLVLRQWRQGPQRFAFSFPGGHVEPGEDPAQTALRELVEETGYEAESVTQLGRFCMHSNFGLGWGSFFLANGARRRQERGDQDLEAADIHALDVADLEAAIADGEVVTVHDALCARLALAASG